MSEGVDYELMPVDVANDQAWDVRILSGDFTESVIRFGGIRFDGERDCLTFNFIMVDSTTESTSADPELQEVAGAILEDVLEKAASEGWMITGDANDAKRHTPRADDFTQLTY